MRGKSLEIITDPVSGGVSYIGIPGDVHRMNWCESATSVWGVPYFEAQTQFNRFDPLMLVSYEEGKSVYENAFARVSVTRSFDGDGVYSERYVFKNVSASPLFVDKGKFGIFTPFNDNYDSAEYCLTNKCHTHIFCGGASSWVCALRMGQSDQNVGLILKEGSLDCYRQWLPPYAKNDRGDFMLCVSPFDLLPGEKYVVAWDIVLHFGKEDFISRLSLYDTQIVAIADFDTVFCGEKLEVDLSRSKYADPAYSYTVNRRGVQSDPERHKKITLIAKKPGEIELRLSGKGNASSRFKYFVSEPLDRLVDARVRAICTKQQYSRPGHPLDGAYLIRDNETGRLYFSSTVADHNASRERIGMGILIAKYLQKTSLKRKRYIDASLAKYEEFVLREFVDPETGDVFDTIGRDLTQIRLYNAPWVCVFMCELYKLRKQTRYLEIASRVMKKYYAGGGDRFYPNAFSVAEPIKLMREAGLERESEELFESAVRHTENIISNGTDYPKHEVDYEQTIVAPALTYLLQMFELTSDARYLEEARPHLALLERFNGFQPDYRLNEVAIRHWDDYWFGKRATFGDTFPHYWSILSGWCFFLWYRATGDEEYKHKAERSARNCLCLFRPDGEASCAYVFPYMLGDKRGEFYDPWANDQDFALYFALKILKGEN